MEKPISHHEALVFAMVTMSAADRTMSEAAVRRIGEVG